MHGAAVPRLCGDLIMGEVEVWSGSEEMGGGVAGAEFTEIQAANSQIISTTEEHGRFLHNCFLSTC